MNVVARLRAAGCVFAEDEAALLLDAAATPAELEALVARREAGEPLEYIVGWAEFCGLRLRIEPGVFVPRHRTEFLVEQAAQLAGGLDHPVVVDLCCGSGAIGAALAARVDGVEVHAADLDPAAVRCAQRNVNGPVYQGDLFDALPGALRGRIDILVVNAPYVPTDAIAFMPPEARDHEARVALDGGADGTDVQRRIIAAAPSWLASAGHLLTETSAGQAAALIDAVAAAGLHARVVTADDATTVLVASTRR